MLFFQVFALRFVSYFVPLFYYAYIATGIDKTIVENGILRVSVCLFVYLTISHWWTIILGIQFPLALHKWRLKREKIKIKSRLKKLAKKHFEYRLKKTDMNYNQNMEKDLMNQHILLEHAQNKIWEELMLPSYDPLFDYVQAAVQFAYVVCFSAVFPLTPLLVLFNQLINMRLNAFKICRGRRRPLAQKTGGVSNCVILFISYYKGVQRVSLFYLFILTRRLVYGSMFFIY